MVAHQYNFSGLRSAHRGGDLARAAGELRVELLRAAGRELRGLEQGPDLLVLEHDLVLELVRRGQPRVLEEVAVEQALLRELLAEHTLRDHESVSYELFSDSSVISCQ